MNFMTKTRSIGLMAVAVLVGCAELEPLNEYRPVMDQERTDMSRFERDLESCRAVAVQVEADYRQRQQEQMGANIMAGLLVGAITGVVVGGGTNFQGELAAYGAASGMAVGAAANDVTTQVP